MGRVWLRACGVIARAPRPRRMATAAASRGRRGLREVEPLSKPPLRGWLWVNTPSGHDGAAGSKRNTTSRARTPHGHREIRGTMLSER